MSEVKIQKVAFIDRDGVINKKAAPHHYICRIEDVIFNPGIEDLLHQLEQDGYALIVVTNQRGIARRHLTEQTLEDIHTFMRMTLAKKGITIAAILYCPHEKDVCNCRKPAPGLLQQAFEKFHFIKKESIIVSDSYEDIAMGLEFGLKAGWLCTVDRPLQYRVYGS